MKGIVFLSCNSMILQYYYYVVVYPGPGEFLLFVLRRRRRRRFEVKVMHDDDDGDVGLALNEVRLVNQYAYVGNDRIVSNPHLAGIGGFGRRYFE